MVSALDRFVTVFVLFLSAVRFHFFFLFSVFILSQYLLVTTFVSRERNSMN